MRNRIPGHLSSYELATFRELAEAGSLSRAAERLGLTQPGLSRLVKRLELQVGAPLLIRTKLGVRLTKTGEKFVDESGPILRELDAFLQRVRRQQTEIEGTYVLGAHPQVAAICFPKVFATLLHGNPGLELKLVHDISRRIVERIISYRVDFGIVVDPVRHPDLSIVPLYKDPMAFWRKPGLLSPSALAALEESIVIGDLNLKQTESLLATASRRGRLRKARVLHSADLHVVRELCAGGVGVGLLTKSIATNGPPLTLLEDLPIWMETVCLVYRRDAQRAGAAQFIRNTIVSLLRQP